MPLPWLGFRRRRAVPDGDAGTPAHRWPSPSADPGQEAERFFRRMVGDAAWERLSPTQRAARVADGPALVADLRSLQGPAPFDAEALGVPAVFGRSDSPEDVHRRETVTWLVEHVPEAELMVVPGAGHGAHLSHPDAFAELTRRVVKVGALR